MSSALTALTIAGIVGCGIMAGLFLAFSISALPGLARLPPPEGHAVMRQMNRAILNPLFAVVFRGTALVCVVLAIGSLLGDTGGRWWLAGGALAHLVDAVALVG